MNCDNSGNWSIEALGQTAFDFGTDDNNAHVQPDGASQSTSTHLKDVYNAIPNYRPDTVLMGAILMYKVSKAIVLTMLISRTAMAENVEVFVIDLLDNIQNGYCLDIAKGKGASANPADGMQAHTCYSPLGEVLVDQAFDPAKFVEGILYMPKFDVCVQASSTDTGASVELTTCDGSKAQKWVFNGEGTIAPVAAPEMCLTLSEDTRTGRSDENQMKAITLVTCSDDLASFQTWSHRTAK